MSNTTPTSPNDENASAAEPPETIVPPEPSRPTPVEPAAPTPAEPTEPTQPTEPAAPVEPGDRPVSSDDEPENLDRPDDEAEAPTPPVPASGHAAGAESGMTRDGVDAEPTGDASTPAGSDSVDDADVAPADPDATPGATPADPDATPDATPTDPDAESAASADTVAAPATVPATAPEPVITPVYVTAPTPPAARGNRGGGILIALLAAIGYAIVYAAVSLGLLALIHPADRAFAQFQDYVVSWAFWVPVVVFFLVLVLLVAVVNRGGWWAYVLGGFVVGVVVYFAYIGGALLQVQAWNLTAGQVARLVGQLWANPLTLGAAIVAREATVWFGAWIAARGRRVRQRNLEAQRAFDREVAEGPLAQRTAVSSPSDR